MLDLFSMIDYQLQNIGFILMILLFLTEVMRRPSLFRSLFFTGTPDGFIQEAESVTFHTGQGHFLVSSWSSSGSEVRGGRPLC